ncbi:hypothetical protein PMIN06_005016 [Paraphaeosphaeria minitans]
MIQYVFSSSTSSPAYVTSDVGHFELSGGKHEPKLIKGEKRGALHLCEREDVLFAEIIVNFPLDGVLNGFPSMKKRAVGGKKVYGLSSAYGLG